MAEEKVGWAALLDVAAAVELATGAKRSSRSSVDVFMAVGRSAVTLASEGKVQREHERERERRGREREGEEGWR